MHHESLPPPKRHHITQFQADAGSSSSDDPQLHAPLSDFNPSLPFPDPQHTRASSRFVDDVLLNLHTQTHRITDDSNNEDSEDASEGDAVENADSINPETNDFSDGEDVDMGGDVDLCEGIISDWELLAKGFIVEAMELGGFEPSFLHIPGLTGVFMLRGVFYLRL